MEKGAGQNQKKNIRQLSLEELIEAVVKMGQPSFRGKQIHEWLWKKSAISFDQMTNLPKNFIVELDTHYAFDSVFISHHQVSKDRTIKNIFNLFDGNQVEGVLIPSSERMTACVSSQVGCSLTCKFCATGFMDRKRNLEAAEIVDQVVLMNNQSLELYNLPLTNIVFMGMGEPLLNYASVLSAVKHLTSPEGLNYSYKRITVSTAGISKMIRKLADDKVQFNLAVSLHAANDLKRNEIMPINESNSLETLKDALSYFATQTKNAITLEYIIFDKFNDEINDAEELYQFSRNFPCKINLIEYNPITLASYRNAKAFKVEAFEAYLQKKGLIANIRRSRGKDIDAACGQLALKQEDSNPSTASKVKL
jgi:23S rRNA (adenine2503-C2)-methyltransferase